MADHYGIDLDAAIEAEYNRTRSYRSSATRPC